MTEQVFIAKYYLEDGGVWNESASLLFWANSYNCTSSKMQEMANDFLSIPGIKYTHSSSVSLALRQTGQTRY